MKKHFKDFAIAISVCAIVLYVLMGLNVTFNLLTYFLSFIVTVVLIFTFVLLSKHSIVFFSVIPTAITIWILSALKIFSPEDIFMYEVLFILYCISGISDYLRGVDTLSKLVLNFLITLFSTALYTALVDSSANVIGIVFSIFLTYALVLSTECSIWFTFNNNCKSNKTDSIE